MRLRLRHALWRAAASALPQPRPLRRHPSTPQPTAHSLASPHPLLFLSFAPCSKQHDFGSDIIPGAKDLGFKVQAHLFKGYWEDIGTVRAFYESNLALTDSPDPKFRCGGAEEEGGGGGGAWRWGAGVVARRRAGGGPAEGRARSRQRRAAGVRRGWAHPDGWENFTALA